MTETVGDVLAAALVRGGERIALRSRGTVRTYGELLDNAARFANSLAGMGLRPGEQVALMVTDRVEAVEAYVGCLLGGYPAVHVNDRLVANEVRAVLSDADARAFVYTEEVAGTIAGLDAVAETDVVVSLGQAAEARHMTWVDLLSNARPDVPRVRRAPEDLGIIGYTSGSTGRPKGVMHSQQTLLRIIRHIPVHFDIRPRSRCAFNGTLSFATAIWGVLLPHLYLGGEVSFMGGLTPEEWFDRMVDEGSNFTYIPTPLAGAFLEQLERRPELLDTLRVAMHSGSKMPAASVEALVDVLGPRFGEAYGMTETGSPVTRTEDSDWTAACGARDIYSSVGRAVHIADLTIVDTEGRELPAGEVGQITVRADTQFVGYYKQPDLTAQTVIDGRLWTGDLGMLDESGYLYVTDRAKDMIVSGGMNVYPAEVESALAGLPGLDELAVFGVPDERWGETVVAVAVVSDPSLDEAALVRAARERIASYKKPTRVRFMEALPRTASMKIDKPALRRLWADDQIR